MNFGRGISIPQENDMQKRNSWMPVTPEKPIQQRSNPENWQELAGIYGEFLQETTNYNGEVQNFNPVGLTGLNGGFNDWDVAPAEKGNFNHNAGSYTQAFGNDSPLAELLAIKNAKSEASRNGTASEGIHFATRPADPNSYSQVESNWTESNSTCLFLGNQNQTLGSNQWINGGRFPKMSQDGFPVPYWPVYNLNSPPRSEADAASSVTNSFQFAPVTPDQAKQFENHCRSGVHNFSVDDSSSQEKDKHENVFASVGSEAIENHSDELLQNIVDSSSAVISTLLKEKNNSDQGGDGDIDLNKTPQQKPSKRRKHRPKVVVEGKPKRTPKSTTPKNTESMENPSGKRKYVRRNGLKASVTHQADVVSEVTVPTVGPAAKSCRRVLNFDMEKETRDECQEKAATQQAKIHPQKREAINLNLDFQSPELFTRFNSDSGTKSAAQIWHQDGYLAEQQQVGTTCNFDRSMDQMPAECIALPERRAPEALPDAMKDHTLNVIARNVNMRNSTPCPNRGKNGYSQVHQHVHGEALSHIVFQANASHENLERTRQLIWQSAPQLVVRNVANSYAKRGSKREYSHTTEQTYPCTENLMGSPLLCKETYRAGDYNSNSSNFSTGPEVHKKRKSENGFHATVSGTPCIAAVKDSSRQAAIEDGKGVYANDFTSQISTRMLQSYFGIDKTSNKLNNGVNVSTGDWNVHSMATEHKLQKQLISSELYSHTQRMAEKRSSGTTQVHNPTLPAAMTNQNLQSLTPPKKAPTSDYVQGIEAYRANMTIKKQAVGQTTSNLESPRTDKVLLQEQKDTLIGIQQFSMKARGRPGKQKYPVPIDEIIRRLKGLNISGSNEIIGQEQNALVPYKGDGTIVPYMGFDPTKRRKPRPKVDLDPETNRIWKLLMGKEGSEGAEVDDKNKEKWWEEERKVFHGRADSFIARMHLVQGDRRFSQWKGSVVDSVVGVFLTQNVSDHLSSSAFMSLAARFPLQTTTNQMCYESGTSILVEEQEVRILNPDVINCHEKIARQPAYNQSSVTSHGSADHRAHNLNLGTRSTGLANEHNRRIEEIIASQNSFGSVSLQANGEIRSCASSNPQAEDTTTGFASNKIYGSDQINLLTTKKTAAIQKFYSHLIGSSSLNDMFKHGHKQSVDTEYGNKIQTLDKVANVGGSSAFTYPFNSSIPHMQGPIVHSSNFWSHMMPDFGVQEVDCFRVLGEESISSLPSSASEINKAKDVDHMSKSIGHVTESTRKTIVQQSGVSRLQASTVGPSAFLSKHPTHQESSLQPVPQTVKDQLCTNTHEERSRTFHLESTLVKKPIKPAEALAEMQTGTRQQVPNDPKFIERTFGLEERISVVDKQKSLENKAVGANAKEQVFSSDEAFSGTGTNTLNTKKGMTEDEKKKSFDWDSLRKQVQPNGRTKERSKDTMDSMNYEAMRLADVNVISNAIKERGMNNMLAERIKDFLNRLVREHGSIDLEWLRDVPPDKVKDYLLSVRGLGLKSVECVRLLTLHHLAFPVDTNVGRIAVRLGWVPLQPLPESLQLHLLELYPMLETIQKYLWPRLCKMDQRTLYELHYQMITFGKVFCTKNKPNCNACPMRGECRHFASAFASARLALPGPEEKSIASSTIPYPANKNPTVAIKPMPLPPAENNASKEAGLVTGKCEPIVEEPATPEPESTEISESDIEDAFYEDPDEIPTIKLNIEEFTLNLHNYIQENSMELQEGDMSKALVALNPEVASIPTPKLKNVSRLRTEHQVYELPDTHPLLQGLDRREPDDPSPYLLAIWTPGETPNSVQPPDRCGSQESGILCNEKTCFSCNSIREANSQTVRGTLLVPCRTAMRGSFPLNGTYFQVNEMFADHDSSLNPIDVPRAWLWNLPRRTVYFGTSVSTIFKGLSTEGIQYCFWRGFVCVRGFDQKTRAPRPLMARLHFPASKLSKTKK
uniref:Putative transcriptional activator DEMETER isoform X2 n=1 Tax=Davidia involucrata TaxID=16924 RepID=A0A5B7A3U4_DAVIN